MGDGTVVKKNYRGEGGIIDTEVASGKKNSTKIPVVWRPSPMTIFYIIAAIVIVVPVLTRILFARQFLDFLRLLTS
jgi:hypothetical protein